MRLAIMQPYFFPYIGYFQLIAAVDLFLLYDNIKYTKKGWINRNRILHQGRDVVFSLPLQSGSDDLDVCQRQVAPVFQPNKLLNRIEAYYRSAPYFLPVFSLLQQILWQKEQNLFVFLHQALVMTCSYLNLTTKIGISSQVAVDHALKYQDKVLALCQAMNAQLYVNAIGGTKLYRRQSFEDKGIQLKFIRSHPLVYPQFNHPFVPGLSIIDVMMFNAPESINAYIRTGYELIDND